MEIEFATPTSEALAAMRRALDVAVADDRSLLSPAGRLALLGAAMVAVGRLQSLVLALVGEAEAAEASMIEFGVGTRGWLVDTHRLSPHEAGSLVKQAERLDRFEHVRAAALAGDVRPQQARAVIDVLAALPEDFSAAQLAAGEQEMLHQAEIFHAVELTRLARHLLECIAPEVVNEAEAHRLERELEMARKRRGITFADDGHGTTRIHGFLPTLNAELLRAQVDAIAHHRHRTSLELHDPLTEQLRLTP